MTKTNAAPKVTFVKPGQFESERPKAKSQALADTYTPAGSDPFKSVITGSPKAESISGGVLSEMFEAASTNTRQSTSYHDRIQGLLRSMAPGLDWRPPADLMANVPHVPDLYKEIFAITRGSATAMEPVISRYAGLERVLTDMIKVATKSMSPTNANLLRSDELLSMQAYRRRLMEALSNCRIQLSNARKHLEIQREKEAAGIW